MPDRVKTTVQISTANDGWFAHLDDGSESWKLPIVAWALVRTEHFNLGVGESEDTVEPVVIADDSQPILLSDHIDENVDGSVTLKLRHD